MLNHRTARLAVLALLSLAVLGACGDSDGEDGAPSDTTAEGSAAPGATGDAVDCADTPGETVTVEIGDFVYDPEPVQVGTCDEIVWSNAHSQAHTSTASGDVAWNTGNIAAGGAADPIVFDTPGEFAYMCALHPFMKGTVEVS